MPANSRVEELRRALIAQGRAVARLLEDAVDALETGDIQTASEVARRDEPIDAEDVRIERAAVAILTSAIAGPEPREGLSAADVRLVLTIVKVNNEFERIADLAVVVAELAGIFEGDSASLPRRFRVMANSVIGMVEQTVNCLDGMDAPAARIVLASDDATDRFRDAILRENEAAIAQSRMTPDIAFALNRVAAAIGRVAEHCTNVAEQVIYVVTGKIVRHSPSGWSDPTDPGPE